jgi:AcrR family transcriptional regulator
VFAPLKLDPVLESAISAFVRSGYHGATTRGIADGAGMSVPGIYHHYPSKQHLLVAILDLAMSELLLRVPAAGADGRDGAESYALMVEALALFHTHRRDLGFIGASEMRSLDPANRMRIAGLRTGLQRRMDDAVSRAVEDGTFTNPHAADAARAISTMCTALSQWYKPDGALTPAAIATEYSQFAVDIMTGPRR